MSRTNCFLPSNGFCLNFRVRTVKSLMAAGDARGRTAAKVGGPLEPNWSQPPNTYKWSTNTAPIELQKLPQKMPRMGKPRGMQEEPALHAQMVQTVVQSLLDN